MNDFRPSSSDFRVPASPQALFLDRDGTLIFDKDYLHEPEKVELIPGTREAVRRVLDSGCKLFLLTNQSGIGRGFFTMADYEACHRRFVELLGVRDEDFSACGVTPEAPDQPSKYRKPQPAFVLEQLAAFPQLDPARCWMVGDRKSDWQTGLNAGIRSAAVATGKPIDNAAKTYLSDNKIPLFETFADFVNATFP
ncbi:MAG: HAD-IIIA family hydrolase [Opitutales bacterium]|nr:HAD-IIIA family hydrolase [Opitutales bacterium]